MRATERPTAGGTIVAGGRIRLHDAAALPATARVTPRYTRSSFGSARAPVFVLVARARRGRA
jgi:hypothetical protein